MGSLNTEGFVNKENTEPLTVWKYHQILFKLQQQQWPSVHLSSVTVMFVHEGVLLVET